MAADNSNKLIQVSSHTNQRDGVSKIFVYKKGNLTFELTQGYCYRVKRDYFMIKTFSPKNGKVISKERKTKVTRIPLNTKPSDPVTLVEKMNAYKPRNSGDYEKAWVDESGNIIVKKKLQQ